LNVRDSFWLIPSIALIAALLLGVGLVELDDRLQLSLAADWPRLFGVGAEGARGTLSAIASSMITVAGVVFSVTIVSLSLAASTYSPRVLRTFMHDRPTQATLGVLVGIFAYCLVVLRTVRSDDGDGGFVPSIAVLVALFLALVGVWTLVYFIHHVAIVIQLPTILQRIANDTHEAIDRLFPDELAEGEDDPDEPVAAGAGRWKRLPALRSGYLVAVDTDGLVALARRHGAVLRMELGIGEFAIESSPLASLAVGKDVGQDDEPPIDARALDRVYDMGPERTIEQDAAFGVEQIVAVAVRALSPAVNNPSAAVMCVDHLSAVLVRLTRRAVPARLRTEGGELRVIAKGPTFESLVALAFEPLLRHAKGHPEVVDAMARAARTIERIAPPRRGLVIRRHLAAIKRAQGA